MKKVKIIFFGTHKFAATVLSGLLNCDSIAVGLVVTMPDKTVGRKHSWEEPPVKTLAKKYNIPIAQPESLKKFKLPISNFHLNIVAQYGLIIPPHILDAPQHGSINIHGSLLPQYRGASPIQTALINGDIKTGITLMLLDREMDHGPILAQETIKIEEDDTYPLLSYKMAKKGLDLLINTIPKYIKGEIMPQPQAGSPTFTKLLTREDGRINFNKTGAEIYNQYRGLYPWPGIWCKWNEKRLKLIKINKSDEIIPPGNAQVENNRIYIGCGHDSIEINELQMEDKKSMDAKTFLNGYKNIDGAKLT